MLKFQQPLPTWDYSQTHGPANWDKLCATFAKAAQYTYQSPISLSTAQATPVAQPDPLVVTYHAQMFKIVRFTQSVHFVPTTAASSLEFNGQTYHLTDIHFHLPSEHILDGQRYPLEIHLVHRNAQRQGVVFATMVTVTNDTILPMPNTDWSLESNVVFDPTIFLPTDQHALQYTGTLTTPPTRGPVTWLVMQNSLPMPHAWFQHIKQLAPIANNARPLQPRFGRPIYLR